MKLKPNVNFALKTKYFLICLLNGARIDPRDSVLLLGVTLDSKLTFETHIKFFRSIKIYLPKELKENVKNLCYL